MAALLLEHNADVNQPDSSGYRALTWAAMENEVHVLLI